MTNHKDTVMHVVKQESVEVEVTFVADRNGQVKTESVDDDQRSMAPSPEPVQAVNVVKDEHAQASTPRMAGTGEHQPIRNVRLAGVKERHGGDAPSKADLVRITQEIRRAESDIKHWAAVNEVAADTVDKWRAKYIGFSCLLKVVDEQFAKHESERAVADASLKRVVKMSESKQCEIATLKGILLRHHAEVHGRRSLSNGVRRARLVQTNPIHPECAVMAKFRARLAHNRKRLADLIKVSKQAARTGDEASENFKVDMKNKLIVAQVVPALKQTLTNVEARYILTATHLKAAIRHREEQIAQANKIQDALRAMEAHHTPVPVRVRL